MIAISESILIDAPRHELFDLFHDLDFRTEWDQNVQTIEWVNADGPEPGAVMRGTSRAIGRTIDWQAEVVEHVTNRRTRYRSLSGPFTFDVTIHFDDFDGATRFRWEATVEGAENWLGRLTSSLAVKRYGNELRANLRAFRRLVAERLVAQA